MSGMLLFRPPRLGLSLILYRAVVGFINLKGPATLLLWSSSDGPSGCQYGSEKDIFRIAEEMCGNGRVMCRKRCNPARGLMQGLRHDNYVNPPRYSVIGGQERIVFTTPT